MAATSSQTGFDTFERLEIEYERAYGDNALKKACVEAVIALLPPKQKILDVGCGTGKPVSDMLSVAGHEVLGIDISPRMVQHATSRVKGSFQVADILEYQPQTDFAAVFIMFSLLQLTSYGEFHAAVFKYASHVQPDGYLILGTVPADNYAKNKSDYDETGSYAEGCSVPFMGEPEPNLVFASRGLVDIIRSMGFEIVSNELGSFQPSDSRCEAEDQQYIIARRDSHSAVRRPQPEPLPKAR